jgi:hypothetical protein
MLCEALTAERSLMLASGPLGFYLQGDPAIALVCSMANFACSQLNVLNEFSNSQVALSSSDFRFCASLAASHEESVIQMLKGEAHLSQLRVSLLWLQSILGAQLGTLIGSGHFGTATSCDIADRNSSSSVATSTINLLFMRGPIS